MFAENKMFFIFYFLLFSPLVISFVVKSVFKTVSFYKLYFIFCIISLIFFLVYIVSLLKQSSPIVSDVVTSLEVFFTSQSHSYVYIIVILSCALVPSSIVYACMVMPYEKGNNLGALFYIIIFLPIYFFLMICVILLELCKRFIQWILKICKKPICWLLRFCKNFIRWISRQQKNLFHSLSKSCKKFFHRLSESDNKFISWLLKLWRRFICWLQV